MVFDLYKDPKKYDLMFAETVDIDFWKDRCATKKDVLELACGTGRIINEIVVEGMNAYGIDISKDMLSIAIQKAIQKNKKVKYIEADITNFEINSKFDVIFLGCNSIGHILTNKEFSMLLKCVKRHLKYDGIFIIDVFTPSISILHKADGSYKNMMDFNNENNSKILVEDCSIYNPGSQILKSTWRYYTEGQELIREEVFIIKMYFPAELDALLEMNGFEIVNKYGNYLGEDYSKSQSKQILITKIVTDYSLNS
jgi:SAM-dependent methyltransferase